VLGAAPAIAGRQARVTPATARMASEALPMLKAFRGNVAPRSLLLFASMILHPPRKPEPVGAPAGSEPR
jgi:hypothetical protein